MRTLFYLVILFFIQMASIFAQPIFRRNETKFKGFMQIGASGSHASIPAGPTWKVSDNFTIEAVIRFNKPLNPTGGAIFVNTVGPSGSDDWGWGFVAIDRRFGFHVCSPQPTQNMANQTDTVSACKWYHLTGVKEGNDIRFYLDGVLKATTQFPDGQSVRGSSGPAQFGFHRPPFNNWFDGNIDEFRLWDVARTQNQIQSTMNDTLLGNEPGLQAYYKFNETGQGNDIVVKNSAQSSGSQIDGTTQSNNANFPRLTNTEVLPFPPPPIVPSQPTLCNPGGQFNLTVNSPTGLNINRFYWYSSNHPDTSRIPNTIRRNYRTANLGQTDTFFVSAVNSQFCESRKVGVLARVLPYPASVAVTASRTSFCGTANITFTATNFPNSKYSWFRGRTGTIPIFNPDSGATITLPNLNKTDTVWVQYQKLDNNCLSNKDFIIVTRNAKAPAPDLVSPSVRVCNGQRGSTTVSGAGTQKVRLYADSALTQLISEVNFNQVLQTPVILTDRVFWVSLSADPNGCESFGRKWAIGTNPLPLVNAGFGDTLCSGDSVQLGGPGNSNIRYKWTPAPPVNNPISTFAYNNDTISNPFVRFNHNFLALNSFKFKVLGLDKLTGCQNADSVNIVVGANPPKLGRSDTTLCGTNSIQPGVLLDGATGSIFDSTYRYTWISSVGTFQNFQSRKTGFTLVNNTQNQIVAIPILSTVDSRTGCTTFDTVQILSNPLPLVSAGRDTALCSGFSTQIGFAGNVNQNAYKWLPVSGLSKDTISNPIVLLPNTGASFTNRYILLATNKATGCRKSDTVSVTSNALPLALGGTDKVLCSGENTSLGFAGNIAQVKYNWWPNTFLSADTISQVSVSGLNNTQQPIDIQYILSAEHRSTRCRNRDTVLLRVNPLPLVSAGRDTALCSGFSTQIGFAGNLQTTKYQWFNGSGLSLDTISNPIFTKINTGSNFTEQKIIRATFRNTGCEKSDTVLVTVFPLPRPNAGQDQEFCFNGSATLGTIQLAGFQYNWSPIDSLESPNSAVTAIRYFNADTLNKSFLYVLNARNDTTGCEAKDSVRIRVKGFVRAEIGVDKSFCSGASTSIGSSGFQQHSYSWAPTSGLSNPGIPAPVISLINASATNLPDTISYQRITSFNGCQNIDSLKVIVFPRPVNLAITGSKNVCPGTTQVVYQVVSNTLGHSLNWSQSGGNFDGGSSGDSVLINWGETNSNARVRFRPINIFGCTGDSALYIVQINRLLFPEITIVSDRNLINNDSVCKNDANAVRYRTAFTTAGSSYAWKIEPSTSGSILGNPSSREVLIRWNAPGTYQLSVSQFDTTNIDTCFGTSQIYNVHILPSPDTSLMLTGPENVCAFSTNNLYQFAGNQESGYEWKVSRPGENQSFVSSSGAISISFGKAGNDTIQVLETNALRCKGIWIPKIVSVKPLPNTIASASNDYNVCPESGVKGYKVFGLPGSVFEWILSGQFELPRGQGTDSIYTIWGGSNPRLKVLETSAFGCISDTLKFNLNYDNSQPEIISVSTLEADDSKIEIKFGLKSPQNHPTKTFELWKDGSLLSSFNALETRFIDIGVQTQEKIYTYETQTKNSCGTVLKSGLFNNMVLRSLALENEGKSDLTWNRYNPNVEAPVQYNVLRKVDNVVLDGTFGTLNFLQSETPAELKSSIFETYNGFKQCYRTTFSKNGIIESYSNWSCVDFENRLVFPNLITPNGDGKNDVFEIRNISLFPDATLSIFNRWGEEVYSTANYQNDWKDKDGVYFYKFKSGTIDNNGWITVVK